ncbi:EAL domain-containing protein [Reinekea sp.]|jgi:diguanylate cyclase (GGDEF)-like protein|uniref:bifunctional diguanylate cyclase/phosphodiesterase n=1 Tax=Reinekea sp. TaxID=1970455 RepID=UPI0039897706
MKRWLGHYKESANVQSKAWLIRVLMLIISFVISGMVCWQLFVNQQTVERLQAENLLQLYSSHLQAELDRTFSSITTLSSLANDPGLTEARFYSLAHSISSQTDSLLSLQLAPNAVVTYVYPIKENRNALGHRLREDSSIGELIAESIETGKVLLDGPKPILQGGQGIIARLPIYVDSLFWGFATAVLKYPEMLEEAGLSLLEQQGFKYDLWRIDASGEATSILTQLDRTILTTGQVVDIQVPGQTWQFAIKRNGSHQAWINLALYGLVAAILSLVFVEFVVSSFLLYHHRSNLQLLVEEQIEKLSASEHSLRQAQTVAQMGSWEFTIGLKERRFSEQAQTLLQLDKETLENNAYQRKVISKYRSKFKNLLNHRGTDRLTVDYQVQLTTGEVWLREVAEFDVKQNMLIGTIQDISREIRDQEVIWQQANIDPLTMLANANLLSKKIQEFIALSEGTPQTFTVFVVDIDNFKRVNDSLGSHAGDEVLKQMAMRLNRCLINDGCVARYSGDEFVIVTPDTEGKNSAQLVADLIMLEMQKPFQIHEGTRFMTASIGVACWPQDGKDSQELIQLAEIALHEVKSKDRGQIGVYRREMLQMSQQLAILEVELQIAIQNNELSMVYQPIVDTQTKKVVSLEALIRWHHPKKGLVSPVDFIPVAETTGLILPLGRWIVNQVAKDCHALLNTPLQNARVAVNISRIQFVDDSFVPFLVQSIEDDFPATQKITLEITESTLHQDAEHSVGIVSELTGKNIQVALDDFGTGYSSFISLKEFHVNNVKIDRSFISNCDKNKDDQTLVKAIIEMAHTMGFTVTAEGVETQSQVDLLMSLGCDYLQGFWFSKPKAIAEIVRKGLQY